MASGSPDSQMPVDPRRASSNEQCETSCSADLVSGQTWLVAHAIGLAGTVVMAAALQVVVRGYH